MRGTVKFVNEKKGFGFIEYDGEEQAGDYFFHVTSVEGDQPEKGDEVEFNYEHTPKGLRAQNVKKV